MYWTSRDRVPGGKLSGAARAGGRPRPVRPHLLENDRRREVVRPEAGRVDRHEAADRREPEPPVAGPDPAAPVALGAPHPVRDAEGAGRDPLQLAAREGLELALSHPEDPLVAAQPEVPEAVAEDPEHGSVEEPVGGRHGRERSAAQPAQAVAHGADPERSVRVGVEVEVAQPVEALLRPGRKDATVPEAPEASRRPDPESPVAILGEGDGRRVSQAVLHAEAGRLAALEARQAEVAADPEDPVPVLEEGPHRVSREPVPRDVTGDPAVLQARQASRLRPDPEPAVPRSREG